MKISVEYYDKKFSVEFEDGSIYELVEQFKNIALFMTYHPQSIQKGFINEAEEMQQVFDSIVEDREEESDEG